MRSGLRFVVIGVVVLGVVGCAPVVRPLGEEPLAGAGGEPDAPGGGMGGGVLPGASGSGTGGSSGGKAPVAGSTGGGDAGASGGGGDVGAGGEPPCWSPRRRAEDRYPATDVPGCACEEGEAACPYFCVDGRWKDKSTIVDCVFGAACQVGDWIYTSNYAHVPSPYDFCNTCTCVDGELKDCTTKECADRPCPEGQYGARECRQCGPAGGCAVVETGCFEDPSCEDGACDSTCL